MRTTLKSGRVAETFMNWENPHMYDIFIYDGEDGEMIDMDFARSDNERELIEEAELMF